MVGGGGTQKKNKRSKNNVPAGSTRGGKKFLQFLRSEAREFSLFADLENMGTTLQDQLKKKRHREPGKLVINTHSGVPPFDDRCSLDPWCVLEVVSDELVGRTPEGAQTLLHLELMKDMAWRTNTSADLRTAHGLLVEYRCVSVAQNVSVRTPLLLSSWHCRCLRSSLVSP